MDEELGQLPRSVNSKRKWDEGDENDDEWDLDASIDTVSKGQRPYKKPRKDPCPSKQPYHGYKKTGKGKTSTTEASVVSTTVTEETRYVTGGASKQVGLQARIMTFPKRGGGAGQGRGIAMKQPRNPPLGHGRRGQQRGRNPRYNPNKPTIPSLCE